MKKVKRLTSVLPAFIQRKRVAAYARVSMDTEQLLHSLSAQVSHYSELIQLNPEWEYAGVYVDEGVTGTSIVRREEFKRLIDDCDAGKIDLILTKSISRFARDTVDCLNTVRHLKQIGVEVRFERENISTLSADGELLLTLLASFAQAESESIGENIKWAIRKRFEQGIPNGHKAPYGYEWDGEKYRIIPEQGEVVRFIFKQYLAGVSGYSIAKMLQEQGILGQSGVPMCDSTIKDIVSNISYTGTMILQKNFMSDNHKRRRNKGELVRYAVTEMYEPLVSSEDFEQAILIRQHRAAESANAKAIATRFSGLVKCGWCGSGVSRRTAKAEKRWVCNTRERKGSKCCDLPPLTEHELEMAAVEALGDVSEEEFRLRVRRISIFGDRIEFVMAEGKTRAVPRRYDRFNAKKAFSGRLVCGECGAKLSRDTWRKRTGTREKVYSWGCTTSRSICALHRISEENMLKVTSSVLGVKCCEAAFAERVRRAVVFNDRIQYELRDGTVQSQDR